MIYVAGGPGFEPRLTESESAVLPLNYPPTGAETRLVALQRGASIAKRGGRRKRVGRLVASSHRRLRAATAWGPGGPLQTCSTATTPGAALIAPAIAALTE
jgi:hypothetical protein